MAAQLGCTTWLHKLLVASLSAGHPITNHVARPLAPVKTFFCEHGMTASDLGARAKERFHDAKIGGNLCLHGSGRGSIQHARFTEGQPRHMVQDTAQIRCEQVMRIQQGTWPQLYSAALQQSGLDSSSVLALHVGLFLSNDYPGYHVSSTNNSIRS